MMPLEGERIVMNANYELGSRCERCGVFVHKSEAKWHGLWVLCVHCKALDVKVELAANDHAGDR